MKRIVKNISIAALFLGATAAFSGCYTNPVTGRKGINLVDAGTMNGLSSQQYTQFLTTSKTDNNSAQGKMVQKVGNRIATAVKQYLQQQGKAAMLNNFDWQFNYVVSPEVNAWCMPGGRVVVYSGIMPVAQDEAGLAVIMGHEVAHAIAHHGSERMSQGLLQQAGGVTLAVLMSNKPQQTQQLFNSAYGITTNTAVMLPFSRKHESEADEMGLIFMAMAGYDPNAAIPFWQRMGALSKGAPPEFLSTHPAPATRVENLRKLIPKAKTYYKPQ